MFDDDDDDDVKDGIWKKEGRMQIQTEQAKLACISFRLHMLSLSSPSLDTIVHISFNTSYLSSPKFFFFFSLW